MSAVEDFMSDSHATHDDGPHEGPIKTPKQVIVAVLFSFIVPILVIVLLVTQVAVDKRPAAGSDGLTAEATAKRIHPVATVKINDPNDMTSLKTGEQVFQAQCTACHTSGAAGAPKVGDAAAWAPRIAQGFEALLNSAIKGKGAMGAQGGGDYRDIEVARAVVYLANKGGAKFAEPAVPAPKVAAAEAVAAPAPVAASVVPAAAPVVATAAPAAAAEAAVPALYTQACSVCHAAGVAGAPKLGDKAAWSARLAAGVDGLTASAIKGKNAMPPRGGSQGSDADIKAVVTYMVSAVK
jgi:cytochrome c5